LNGVKNPLSLPASKTTDWAEAAGPRHAAIKAAANFAD
jgi:hypothetical protein